MTGFTSNRNTFSPREDELLVSFIAELNPQKRGRSGNALYQKLVETQDWGRRHPWQGWRDRYIRNQNRLDRKIQKRIEESEEQEQAEEERLEDEWQGEKSSSPLRSPPPRASQAEVADVAAEEYAPGEERTSSPISGPPPGPREAEVGVGQNDGDSMYTSGDERVDEKVDEAVDDGQDAKSDSESSNKEWSLFGTPEKNEGVGGGEQEFEVHSSTSSSSSTTSSSSDSDSQSEPEPDTDTQTKPSLYPSLKDLPSPILRPAVTDKQRVYEPSPPRTSTSPSSSTISLPPPPPKLLSRKPLSTSTATTNTTAASFQTAASSVRNSAAGNEPKKAIWPPRRGKRLSSTSQAAIDNNDDAQDSYKSSTQEGSRKPSLNLRKLQHPSPAPSHPRSPPRGRSRRYSPTLQAESVLDADKNAESRNPSLNLRKLHHPSPALGSPRLASATGSAHRSHRRRHSSTRSVPGTDENVHYQGPVTGHEAATSPSPPSSLPKTKSHLSIRSTLPHSSTAPTPVPEKASGSDTERPVKRRKLSSPSSSRASSSPRSYKVKINDDWDRTDVDMNFYGDDTQPYDYDMDVDADAGEPSTSFHHRARGSGGPGASSRRRDTTSDPNSNTGTARRTSPPMPRPIGPSGSSTSQENNNSALVGVDVYADANLDGHDYGVELDGHEPYPRTGESGGSGGLERQTDVNTNLNASTTSAQVTKAGSGTQDYNDSSESEEDNPFLDSVDRKGKGKARVNRQARKSMPLLSAHQPRFKLDSPLPVLESRKNRRASLPSFAYPKSPYPHTTSSRASSTSPRSSDNYLARLGQTTLLSALSKTYGVSQSVVEAMWADVGDDSEEGVKVLVGALEVLGRGKTKSRNEGGRASLGSRDKVAGTSRKTGASGERRIFTLPSGLTITKTTPPSPPHSHSHASLQIQSSTRRASTPLLLPSSSPIRRTPTHTPSARDLSRFQGPTEGLRLVPMVQFAPEARKQRVSVPAGAMTNGSGSGSKGKELRFLSRGSPSRTMLAGSGSGSGEYTPPLSSRAGKLVSLSLSQRYGWNGSGGGRS